MDNQNALTSTAMLAAIWEHEKKDNLELILPFITYSIGKVISVGNRVDITSIATYLSTNLGFYDIPHSVLQKAFKRLSKRKILERKNQEIFLKIDLSENCKTIDLQLQQAQKDTDEVIKVMTEYLNQRNERLLKKDFSEKEIRNHFIKFLETKGYFVYEKIEKLQEISACENTIYYHIAQFIIAEYHKKSVVFSYIENIVKGLLLSRVIYGYIDVTYNEKFKDVCVYVDTTLLLCIFAFKSDEQNTAASQLVEILLNNNISIKCFKHNYDEVYKIIEAYKYSILNSSNRHGQTIEYFDKLGYSTNDVERVLHNLEDYFKEKSIEIVDTPSLSSDGSGTIVESDFQKAIGETELKEHLSKKVFYKNDMAISNDIESISAIHILRQGKIFKKIEKCKALFVTTNHFLVDVVQRFLNDTSDSVPLLISDLELTSLLWLKNPKRFSDFPTLKLIESARISLEPTEQIRTEFIKKIEQFKNEPAVTEERASAYRQLIYTEKEKLMGLIDGRPENISNIQLTDLEDISRQHYNSQLNDENKRLKQQIEERERKIRIESNEKVERVGEITAKILKFSAWVFFAALLIISIKTLYTQWKETSNYNAIILLGVTVLGLIDAIVPRCRRVNKLIMILANKRKMQVARKEQERIQKILES